MHVVDWKCFLNFEALRKIIGCVNQRKYCKDMESELCLEKSEKFRLQERDYRGFGTVNARLGRCARQ